MPAELPNIEKLRCQEMPCNGTFGWALWKIAQGHTAQRVGWNGKGLWIRLQQPDDNSKMTLPYIYMGYPDDAQNTPGARVPWLASQTDMLATDWQCGPS